MEKWRPDNWENPYEEGGEKAAPSGMGIQSWGIREKCYEAGADAILEAIWKLAKESPTGTFIFDSKMVNIYSNEEVKE